MTFKPLIQTVRMINIQKQKKQFVDNAQQWAQKMTKIYQSCTVASLKVQILIQIVGCRVIFLAKPQTQSYWLDMVDMFFKQIQKRLPNIILTNQVDLKLIDWLAVIIHLQQIQNYLLENKKRFLSSLIAKMKKNPDPKNAFHYQKYYKMRNTLITLFFFRNKELSIKQIEQILIQFNRKALSVLKDSQQNIQFFDCMCEMKLPIAKNHIIEIIRSLANGHSRKTLPVHVLIILTRVLHAASQQPLPEQNISSIIKSLSQSIASKINDPAIFDLRLQISRYYITLANKYIWNDQKSTQIMLLWCQEFQRNNKLSTPQTIILLGILTKKYKSTVLSAFSHKLQGLITDITYKLKFNKVYNNIPAFVSLLTSLYLRLDWPLSHKFVVQICSQDPQDSTFLYLLQSQILIRQKASDKVKLQQKQIKQIKFIIQNIDMWRKASRLNVYLYCLEVFFNKISQQQAFIILKQLDEVLTKLFNQMNDQAMYHPMIQLAARVYFRVGRIDLLKKLNSYNYFKSVSFEILSKSFHKQTVILMCYMYSMLLNRADDFQTFFIQLNEEKFLNYLFQGCDQFIGKSPKFFQQQCYIILMAIKGKQSVKACGYSNLLMCKQIQKNVVWWQQSRFLISYKLPQQQLDLQATGVLIQQFKEYYEEQVQKYFDQQIKNWVLEKHKIKSKDNDNQDDNLQL